LEPAFVILIPAGIEVDNLNENYLHPLSILSNLSNIRFFLLLDCPKGPLQFVQTVEAPNVLNCKWLSSPWRRLFQCLFFLKIKNEKKPLKHGLL
jgi:hypothetical protein